MECGRHQVGNPGALSGLTVSNYNWNRWDDCVRYIQNGDLYASSKAKTVACAHVLVRELKKKGEKNISHFIVTEADLVGPKNKKLEGMAGFLYAKPRCCDSYEERCIVFFHTLGNGEWASVKGLAFDAFKHDVALNRVKSRMLDAGFIESSVTLESPTQKSKRSGATGDARGNDDSSSRL